MAKGEGKVVAQNKKARHDYTIVDTIEAGMVLTGTEIKSVRGGIPPLPEKKKFLDRFRKKKDDQKKNA